VHRMLDLCAAVDNTISVFQQSLITNAVGSENKLVLANVCCQHMQSHTHTFLFIQHFFQMVTLNVPTAIQVNSGNC